MSGAERLTTNLTAFPMLFGLAWLGEGRGKVLFLTCMLQTPQHQDRVSVFPVSTDAIADCGPAACSSWSTHTKITSLPFFFFFDISFN